MAIDAINFVGKSTLFNGLTSDSSSADTSSSSDELLELSDDSRRSFIDARLCFYSGISVDFCIRLFTVALNYFIYNNPRTLVPGTVA